MIVQDLRQALEVFRIYFAAYKWIISWSLWVNELVLFRVLVSSFLSCELFHTVPTISIFFFAPNTHTFFDSETSFVPYHFFTMLYSVYTTTFVLYRCYACIT
jgi:hypothetical protein